MKRGKNLPAVQKGKKKVIESLSESETETELADDSIDDLKFERIK